MDNKKKLIIIGIITMTIITSLSIVFYFFVSSNSKPDAVITLGVNGFEPKRITIHKGDTVEFRTTQDKFYWPASNLHPTHELYSDFDPKEPIDPSDTWSFTFEEVGSWQFHDHLAPYYTGTITVTDK